LPATGWHINGESFPPERERRLKTNGAIMKQDTQPKSKGFTGAQVVKAAELVNYQDGSIVSRELVKKPTGTVTVFAFDEGQGLSEHTAPFDALVQVVEGEVEIHDFRQAASRDRW
jgi:quercetin dioxygenase-like cupin family protein